jgi:hypothetical protein
MRRDEGRVRPGAALLLAALNVGCARLPAAIADEPTASATSIAVSTLSKGKGVPAETRAAFARARALLEELKAKGRVARLHERRLGLEGETKLCVEFKDASTARDARDQLRAIAREVTLMNVVEEPCPGPQ